jgi:pimeloyl-ACP methyl ester carboxylesterase
MIAGIVFNDIGPELQREGLLRIKGYVGRLGPTPSDHARGAETLRSLFERHFPALGDEEWRRWSEVTWVHGPEGLTLDHDPALARNLDGIDADTSLPDLWPQFDALPDVPILAIRGEHSDLLSAETLVRMAAWRPGVATETVTGEGHTPLLHRPALVDRIDVLVGAAEARAI